MLLGEVGVRIRRNSTADGVDNSGSIGRKKGFSPLSLCDPHGAEQEWTPHTHRDTQLGGRERLPQLTAELIFHRWHLVPDVNRNVTVTDNSTVTFYAVCRVTWIRTAYSTNRGAGGVRESVAPHHSSCNIGAAPPLGAI